jgi:hypothetical protein
MRGGGLDRLSQFLNRGPNEVVKSFKEAVFFAEKTIKKEFMSVVDGPTQPNWQKRTKFPGVRARTGNLRRSVQSKFQVNFGLNLEAAIGTNVGYGKELNEDQRYEYLKPGLDKAMPEIKKLLDNKINAELRK